MTVAESLSRALPALRVSADRTDRVAYARDLWPRHHIGVRAGRVPQQGPALVVWPETTEQVAALLRFAASERVPLVPYGAGSGVCGAILPDAASIVVDLKRMSRWRALDESGPVLDVEAGALGISLEEDLARMKLTTGHFPSSILCSTVGGWIAARGAGQCSSRYGKIEDMVASVECVLGDGEVVTAHRRTAGPSLVPLFIGSEGTMGIVTSARLRLHPAPSRRSFGSFAFPDLAAGWNAMRDMFQAGLRPAVARLYDPFDSLLARIGSVKGSSGHAAKSPRAPGAGAAMLRNVLRAPGAFNGLIDALGSRVLGGAMLVLVFEGAGEEPLDDLARAARLCEGRSARCLGEGPARHWLEHRYSISYRQSPVFAAGAFSDTMEVAAPWSRLGELYDAVRHALGKHVFVMAHLSHAYPGGCSIYFTFAGSARDDAACEALYDRAWSDALGAAIGSGGTLSHHHGVGRSKAPRLGEELGAGVDVVRCLMRACDPAGILNPGNLVPPGTAARRAPGATNEPAALALDQTSLLARVPGSMTLAAVETSLAAQRVTLDLATDAPRGETVAAWLAKGAPGGPDPWLDPVDHLVAGLAVRLPSGVPLDQRPSPRRAVGPDLASLFVGMFERFGAIRGADLRVRRTDSPRARELANGLDRNPPMTEGESRLLDAMAAGVREIR